MTNCCQKKTDGRSNAQSGLVAYMCIFLWNEVILKQNEIIDSKSTTENDCDRQTDGCQHCHLFLLLSVITGIEP